MKFVNIEVFVDLPGGGKVSQGKVFLSKYHVAMIRDDKAGYSVIDYGFGHSAGIYYVKGGAANIAKLFS